MKSQEFTQQAVLLADATKELREHVKGIRFIDMKVVDLMQDAIEHLSFTILEICEDFDEEGIGERVFRRPSKKKPAPLYDPLEEKAQSLEGP